MRRCVLLAMLFLLAGCAGPAATPIVIYVTPPPTATPSPPSTAVSAGTPTASPPPSPSMTVDMRPTPTRLPTPRLPTPSPEPGELAAHLLQTVAAIKAQSDRLVAASNQGGGPDIYYAIVEIQGLAGDELAWLDAIAIDDPAGATTIDDYQQVLVGLKADVDTIINEWVGTPPAGDYDGPASGDAGSAIADLLNLQSHLGLLSGGYEQVRPIVTPSPTPVAIDFQELRQALKDDVESELEYFIDSVQKVTASADLIEIEIGDTNWVKSILRNHQWTAIEAIADEIYDYGDYWGGITPDVVIKSKSALGGGSLTSRTSADLLRRIYDFEAGESDWGHEAKFTVTGKLY